MNIDDGVGVDLSEASLRFVRLVSQNGSFELRDFGEYFLPEGTLSLGQIKKPDVLKEMLMRFKKEHDIGFAHASVPESLAYLAEMELPSVKNSELHESIELQLEEHIPLKASDAVFDYRIVENEKNKQGSVSVLVSALSKDTASSYADVFAEAGIPLLSLEPDSHALVRSVIPKGSSETSMILDLGRVKTGMYIVSRGAVFFASDADVGEKNILNALISDLNISADGAKEAIRQLRSGASVSAGTNKIISSVFEEIKEEADKHLSYWHSFRDKNGIKRERIDRIILCGSGASFSGLREHLSTGLRLPVEEANVWANVLSFNKSIPKIPFRDSFLYAGAIGLALYS